MEPNNNGQSKTFSKSELKEIEQFYVEKYLHVLNLLQLVPRQPTKSDDGNSDDEEGSFGLHELPARLCPALKKEKPPAKTVDELLARLSLLKGVPKLQYKDKLLKKNLKNRLLKKKKKEQKKQKLINNIKIKNEEKLQKKTKPVFNSEGQVIYSKFDFSVLGAKKADFKKSVKDPKVLLKKIEEQDKKIKSLKEEGQVDKVRDMVQKNAVKTALMRSEGITVKDDTELLKKSIRKKRSQKERSAKKWKARENQVKRDQEERQKKRTKNIQARAHQKKLGKMKKAAKKGRIIPGF